MLLPEKKWYSIEEVAERWEAKQEDVEHYLETKMLWATTRLTDAVLSYLGGAGQFDKFPAKYSGRYVIVDFDKVTWDCSGACDLHERSVVVGKYEDIQHNIDDLHEMGPDTPIIIPTDYKFRFMESYSIKKSDIVIMAREVKLFERKYNLPERNGEKNSGQKDSAIPPYLNGKHPFFSEELCAAVRAWESTFAHNPRVPKGDTFKQDVVNYLKKRRGLGIDAQKRIAIIVNPVKTRGRTNKGTYDENDEEY